MTEAMTRKQRKENAEQYREYEEAIRFEVQQMVEIFDRKVEQVVARSKTPSFARKVAHQYALWYRDGKLFPAPRIQDINTLDVWNELLSLNQRLENDANSRAEQLAKNWPNVGSGHRANMHGIAGRIVSSELQKLYKGIAVEKITGAIHWLEKHRPRWL